MKDIALYRTLTIDQFNKLFKIDLTYSFDTKDKINGLKITEDNGNTICIESENGAWDSIEKGINFDINLNFLYDDLLNNVCYNDSKLSLYALIYSNESKYKKYFKICDIINGFDNAISKTLKIPSGKVTGLLSIEFIVCLAEPGKEQNINGINNTRGAILGKSNTKNIILSGNGSLFPIINISSPNQPLWRFIFDCDEPETDLFLDKVKIELNTAHRDYKLIDITNSETYCERVFLEIMQNSMLQFLSILKFRNCLNDLNQNFMSGTVMKVVQYLVQVHHIEIYSIESISSSLYNYFNEEGGKA